MYIKRLSYSSGAPLLRTPWGPGEVSCIERCPHFRGKFLLRKHYLRHRKVPLINTEVSIFQGCPLIKLIKRGSTVLYTRVKNSHPCRLTHCPWGCLPISQLTTSVIITDDGEEGQEVASLELHPPHSDPDSPYASSVSSQQSVKSTDMLLPGQTSQGGGGKAPGEAGRRTK